MYHTKRIGIFVSHIFGFFQSQLCQGIVDKAAEFGYNTDIFTSMDGEKNGDYNTGENSILRIPNYQELDGIVFASGTYLTAELRDAVLHQLQAAVTCPVIEVNEQNPSYPVVLLENNALASQLADHLITHHGMTRICYLGNQSENLFSRKRQRAFEDTMKHHQIPLTEHSIFSCNYPPAEITQALDYFFSAPLPPQAIICYNDRMALTVMQLLKERGILVPTDIAITGFDHLEEGCHISPALTTVTFPIYEMGVKIMEQLLLAMEGQKIPAATIVTAKVLMKSSCGCLPVSNDSKLSFWQKQTDRINELECSIIHDLNMSESLNGITDIDECMDIVEHFTDRLKNCYEVYLCLYPDWDRAPDAILEITDSADTGSRKKDSLLLKFAMKDGRRISECTFYKKRALPDYIFEASHSAYVYTPLFFGSHAFGYLAFSFCNNEIRYPFSYVSWIMNINHMLQSVCNMKHMGLLSKRLETLYLQDELTGHYNPRGFREKAAAMAAHAKANSWTLTAFSFALNNQNPIYSSLSMKEDSFLFAVLGQALSQAVQEQDLCGHMGNGEFFVLMNNESAEAADKLLRNVEHYLSNYSRLHTKDYALGVTSRYSFWKPQEQTADEPILDSLFHCFDRKQ